MRVAYFLRRRFGMGAGLKMGARGLSLTPNTVLVCERYPFVAVAGRRAEDPRRPPWITPLFSNREGRARSGCSVQRNLPNYVA